MKKAIYLLVALFVLGGCSRTTYNFYSTNFKIPVYSDETNSIVLDSIAADEMLVVYDQPKNINKSVKAKKRIKVKYAAGYSGWASLEKCTFLGPEGSKAYNQFLYVKSQRQTQQSTVSSSSASRLTITDSTRRNSTYTPAPSSSGGSVQVKGYYRKDGTYVRPHTRSAPRRRG